MSLSTDGAVLKHKSAFEVHGGALLWSAVPGNVTDVTVNHRGADRCSLRSSAGRGWSAFRLHGALILRRPGGVRLEKRRQQRLVRGRTPICAALNWMKGIALESRRCALIEEC
ncbi:hypothetical protein NDU88_002018 [Pleurodeles waltl]|uniref:Uncharacterized protein n=1 Tax=Pleurodeles waltl TaxID=8319 RepID=A0AAV7P8S7_PLEWA|nr:hypothetical protein NDU88_002018 [Pleurodeles waltl]